MDALGNQPADGLVNRLAAATVTTGIALSLPGTASAAPTGRVVVDTLGGRDRVATGRLAAKSSASPSSDHTTFDLRS